MTTTKFVKIMVISFTLFLCSIFTWVINTNKVYATIKTPSNLIIETTILELPPLPKEPEYIIPNEYYHHVRNATDETNVPIWIIARIIEKESKWNPKAVGKNKDSEGNIISYDLGLVQLNSLYIKSEYEWKYNNFEEIDPFDPKTSILVACRYLKNLYNATGNWKDAVAAYNCGLKKVLTNTIPKSTIKYVDSIFEGIEDYANMDN